MNHGADHHRAATVAAIIIAYHGDRWMPDCVATLSLNTRLACRMIVVNNIGNTGLERLDCGKHTKIQLNCPAPMGFADANNFALIRGGLQEEFVCFLNQDTVSEAGWLDACIKCLQDNPQIGAVTPLIKTYDGQGWDPSFMDCAKKAPELYEWIGTDKSLCPWYETRVIPAAAMVARSEAIRKAGPFDPIFGSYYEDYDLCHRIRKAGWQVGVCTGGVIRHFSGSATATPEAERRRRRLITRNRVIYMLRHQGDARGKALFGYIIFHFCRNLVRSLLRRPTTQQPIDFLRSHWDLVPIALRMLSARHDRDCWKTYLKGIGW